MMRKLLYVFLACLCACPVPAETPGVFEEYTLQNGMKAFILEDFSSAPVRIEYTARAGIREQTPETAGFFPLYTRLFSRSGQASYDSGAEWLAAGADSSCNADSARYVITAAPSQTETILDQMAHCAFSPQFSDEALQTSFSAMKNEVWSYAFSTAGFINSSIDARIYASAPWKQDTGIYPALFTNTPAARARTILSDISSTYYTPQNSAVFISGGIAKEKALAFAEKTFGSWPAAKRNVRRTSREQPASQRGISGRLFIMHDPVFSADMTQVVVEYTGLSMIQADIAAAAFNSQDSSFKTEMLGHAGLNIRGADYINAAAAHKTGQSRLIFQSLLEKSKTEPYVQVSDFTACIKSAADRMKSNDMMHAQQELISDCHSVSGNSSLFMDKLSQLWAVEGISDEDASGSLLDMLLRRPDDIVNFDINSFRAAYDGEQPYVFVLMNSTVYKKYGQDFIKAGYDPVTQKNGSWYTQELYKAVAGSGDSDGPRDAQEHDGVMQGNAEQYAERNAGQFSAFTLGNGIPVIAKHNDASSSALVMLVISGGTLSSSSNPGFFSILINALAGNIQKEIDSQKKSGTIDGNPSVLAQSDLTSGTISVESLSSDMDVIIPCITRALVYGDIRPAQADGLIYYVRSRKKLHDGDMANQLYSRAVYELFPGTPYPSIYDSDRDILEHTKYGDIADSYPSLLDAGRYTLIVTGKFDETAVRERMESSFGVLARLSSRDSCRTAVSAPRFPQSKKITVQLRHLFLTDESAENAGPRPAVLVPTTDFSDPVQYWLPAPPAGSPEHVVFNALAAVLAERLGDSAAAISADTTVSAEPASYGMQAAVITITHVAHTQQADSLYAAAAARMCKEASDGTAWKQLSSDAVSRWVMVKLAGTQTNRGTALLINEGLELGSSGDALKDAQHYLSDYVTADTMTQEMVCDVCRTYFSGKPPVRLYSKDAKK